MSGHIWCIPKEICYVFCTVEFLKCLIFCANPCFFNQSLCRFIMSMYINRFLLCPKRNWCIFLWQGYWCNMIKSNNDSHEVLKMLQWVILKYLWLTQNNHIDIEWPSDDISSRIAKCVHHCGGSLCEWTSWLLVRGRDDCSRVVGHCWCWPRYRSAGGSKWNSYSDVIREGRDLWSL